MAIDAEVIEEVTAPRSFESAMILREAHGEIVGNISTGGEETIKKLSAELARDLAHEVIDVMREGSPDDNEPEANAIVLIADLKVQAELGEFLKQAEPLVAALKARGRLTGNKQYGVGTLASLRELKGVVDARVAALAEDPVYKGILEATVATRDAIDEILVAEGRFKEGFDIANSKKSLMDLSHPQGGPSLDVFSSNYLADYFEKKAAEVKPAEGRKHQLLVRVIHLIQEISKSKQNINFQGGNIFARAIFNFVTNLTDSTKGDPSKLKAGVAFLKTSETQLKDVEELGNLAQNLENIGRLLERYTEYEALGEPKERKGIAGLFGQTTEFEVWEDAGADLKREISDSVIYGSSTVTDMQPVQILLTDGKTSVEEFLRAAKGALEQEKLQVARMIEVYEKMRVVLSGDDDYLGKLAAYKKYEAVALVLRGSFAEMT